MRRRVVASLLVAATTCLSVGIPALATEANQPDFPSEEVLRTAVEPLITAQQEYYNVQDSTISNIAYTENEDGSVDTTFDLCLTMELKANSVSDLPYVQGMLETIGVESVEDCSVETIETQIKQKQSAAVFTANIEDASDSQLDSAMLSQVIADVISETEEYDQYIGNASDFYYSILVTTDVDGNVTFVGGGTYSNYIPIEEFFPATEDEMKESGSENLLSAVSVAVQEISDVDLVDEAESAVVAASTAYKRVSARDYANKWTSTVSVSPYIDESKYNPAYRSYNSLGGDCANFVSQAIYEGGGISTTSTWKPYTGAWVGSTALKEYFYDTAGLWTESNLANCNAGGVLVYCDSSGDEYHVAMCVHNDTVTRKYSAHNRDRKQVTYTSDLSLTGDKYDYVEYYVFTNSADT